MFETAVRNGARELLLQKEIPETSGVNADIAALLVGAGDVKVALLLFTIGGSTGRAGRDGFGLVKLLVGVVDEVLLVRHDDGVGSEVCGREGFQVVWDATQGVLVG